MFSASPSRSALFALLAGSAFACSDGTAPLPNYGERPATSSPTTAANTVSIATASGSPAPSSSVPTASLPVCKPGAKSKFQDPAPTPLISTGKAIIASGGLVATSLLDGAYHKSPVNFGTPNKEAPAWFAIDLGSGPTQVLLTWTENSFNEYNAPSASPKDYELLTSADSNDGEDGTWQSAVTVLDNDVKARSHSVKFDGQRWLRVVMTAAIDAKAISLDEVTVHDVSDVPEGRSDTWLFFGDSITKGAFQHNGTIRFEKEVNTRDSRRTPQYINAGIGGETTTDALARLDKTLEMHAAARYFAIGYGTNDSWDNPDAVSFERRLTQIVEKVLAQGHVPILARIPYASMNHAELLPFVAVIDRLQQSYELPCGPDLYTWFKDHPEQLNPSDGVHPTDTGSNSMNRLWADSATW